MAKINPFNYRPIVTRNIRSAKPDDKTVVYVPSLVAPLVHDCDDDGNVYRFHSDVHMLLSARDKIKRSSAISEYFSDMMQNAVGSSLPDGVTDDMLLSKVRSRYCSSLSEIKSLIDDINSEYESNKSKLEDSKQVEPAAAQSPSADNG